MKQFRKLLWPFSVLYDGITQLRNWTYKSGISKSESFDIPTLVLGNLSTGGTGKTPATEFFLEHLPGRKAVVSRGYGRQTKGVREVHVNDSPLQVGDEPLQIKTKFPGTPFFVAEKRVDGITALLKKHPDTELILLDDAYQHLSLKARCYVLLTTWQQPFSGDLVLPAGNLRESKKGKKRASIILVTKCPADLNVADAEALKKKLKPLPQQQVFFSTINYAAPLQMIGTKPLEKEIAVLTGIAKPQPFLDTLGEKYRIQQHFKFRDHYNFTATEVAEIKQFLRVHQLPLLTTEKDWMRLKDFFSEQNAISVFVMPIKMEVLFGEKSNLLQSIKIL